MGTTYDPPSPEFICYRGDINSGARGNGLVELVNDNFALAGNDNEKKVRMDRLVSVTKDSIRTCALSVVYKRFDPSSTDTHFCTINQTHLHHTQTCVSSSLRSARFCSLLLLLHSQ